MKGIVQVCGGAEKQMLRWRVVRRQGGKISGFTVSQNLFAICNSF